MPLNVIVRCVCSSLPDSDWRKGNCEEGWKCIVRKAFEYHWLSPDCAGETYDSWVNCLSSINNRGKGNVSAKRKIEIARLHSKLPGDLYPKFNHQTARETYGLAQNQEEWWRALQGCYRCSQKSGNSHSGLHQHNWYSERQNLRKLQRIAEVSVLLLPFFFSIQMPNLRWED